MRDHVTDLKSKLVTVKASTAEDIATLEAKVASWTKLSLGRNVLSILKQNSSGTWRICYDVRAQHPEYRRPLLTDI
jgi:hypothetical protein